MHIECIYFDRCRKEIDPVGTVKLPWAIRTPVFLPCEECVLLRDVPEK